MLILMFKMKEAELTLAQKITCKFFIAECETVSILTASCCFKRLFLSTKLYSKPISNSLRSISDNS